MLFFRKTLFAFLSLCTITAPCSAIVGCQAKKPQPPIVKYLEDKVDDLLKTATIDDKNKAVPKVIIDGHPLTLATKKGILSPYDSLANYLNDWLFRENKKTISPVANNNASYLAFTNDFVKSVSLWSCTTNKNQLPNYDQSVRPELNKFIGIENDFQLVSSSWPIKNQDPQQAEVSVYWQFIITEPDEFYGSWMQTVGNNILDKSSPFNVTQAVLNNSKQRDEAIWNYFKKHMAGSILTDNFATFKANAVLTSSIISKTKQIKVNFLISGITSKIPIIINYTTS